ncbi:MAG: zinc ribbon domain-containing protein [Anaerolineae bacterium]|nr:zinc ribbon domain-containing protein [Anaerolineae bacterium]
MPIYEYVCQNCGHSFEMMRSIKDADLQITCKNCKSNETKRKISSFFAVSGGKAITPSSGCGSCRGGTCSSCHH